MPTDLYEILGVQRDASQDEIRKAYLKLAHKYHPDKTGGDKAAEDKLKEVNAAYDILKSPEKRRQYDQFGAAGPQGFGGGGFGSGGAGGFEAPFDDFFDMLFGQGGGRRRAGGAPGSRPGNDLELRLTITLEEAAAGVKKKVRFNRMERCADCDGSGAAPGSKPETCSQCGGAGQVRMTQGFFTVARACPQCHGKGKTISKPCRRCGGAGQTRGSRELSVDIPAGVDNGSTLRVSGEGEPGHGGGPRGDLYIHIEVAQHEIFQRDGTTLHCEMPISFAQAALGATLRVPTLDKEAELKVPAGTQPGTQFRLRGLGLPDLRGYRQGDLIVKVVVEVPAKLGKRQRELIEELGRLDGEEDSPLFKQFFDRLKRAGK